MSEKRFFPEAMRMADRWLVRRAFSGSDNKQPCSPLAECPAGYKPTPGETDRAWRWRWQQRPIQVTLSEAVAYIKAHPGECDGLSFVVHPGHEVGDIYRIIGIDFDDAFGEDGKPHEWIQSIIDVADSFVEYSRSGKGLHLFIRVKCPPFINLTHHEHTDGGAIEVLCNSQLAVTGRPYGSACEIADVPFSFLESLPFFKSRETVHAATDVDFHSEWWEKEFQGVSDDARTLSETMQGWEQAIRDPNDPCDSHDICIRAARHLVNRGITGHEAVELLKLCPVDSEWTEKELRHKVESAYARAVSEGTFDTIPIATSDGSEFGDITADQEKIDAELALFEDANLIEQPPSAEEWFTCEELLSSPPVQYLIPDILAEGLPCVFGGAEKTLKTSLMVDMAISLATGTDYLSKFPVTEACKVVCISAESGRGSLRSILQRVCAAREIDPNIPNLIWSEQPPDISDRRAGGSMVKLKENIIKHGVKVLMIDPAYLTIPGDGAENVFKIGPMLRFLGDVCKSLGVTMIMAHHTNRKPTGEKFSLRDLSYAGFAEFFRQWVGLRRMSDWTEGISVLQMDVGSSAGHGDSWSVTVDEGIRDGLVDDRRWSVSVCKSVDLPNKDEVKILKQVDENPMPENDLILLSELTNREAKKVLARLVKQGKILYQNGSYVKGTGHKDVTSHVAEIFAVSSEVLSEFFDERNQTEATSIECEDFGFE